MKIVQLITGTSSFGGAEAHVRDLTIGLKARGHQCVVVLGPPEGLLSAQLRAHGIPVVVVSALKKSIHPVRDVVSLLQVVSVLRRLKPDILAAHTAKAGFVARLAMKLTGIPSFYTPHGLSFIDRRTGRHIKPLLMLEQLAASAGGKIIAVCDAERRLALKHLRINENDIVTIYNGVPDRVWQREPGTLPVRITMIARFGRQKDHATLFRALSTLTHLDWELRLAGSGPDLPAAKSLVEQCGLSSRVHFLHECSDTPGLLSETDVFALITNWEAFPISILEAMRAGLPVIATDTGGICEAVKEGENGFLVPRGGVSALAEKLALLLTSPELRIEMGSHSRTRFSQHFELCSMLDKTEAVYADALPDAVTSRISPLKYA